MSTTDKPQRLILLGFSGGGKTTIGARISERLGLAFLDTDDMIAAREGRSINEIFAADGELFFRDLETALLEELVRSDTPAVVSIGGGMPVRKKNRALLKQIGRILYLKASVDTLARRLEGDTGRPLLRSAADLKSRIRQMLDDRESIYLSLADEIIVTDEQSPDETADEICRRSAELSGRGQYGNRR